MKRNAMSYRIMMAMFAIITVFHCLCGCATSGRVGPLFSPTSNMAHLVLIRPPHPIGNLATYYITLNGEEIFALRAGEYTALDIPAGTHNLAIKSYGEHTKPDPDDGITLDVISGSTLYFTIATAYTTQATLRRITSDQAATEMDRCGYIPKTRLSNRK